MARHQGGNVDDHVVERRLLLEVLGRRVGSQVQQHRGGRVPAVRQLDVLQRAVPWTGRARRPVPVLCDRRCRAAAMKCVDRLLSAGTVSRKMSCSLDMSLADSTRSRRFSRNSESVTTLAETRNSRMACAA